MADYIIPLRQDHYPSQQLTVDLDGAYYKITVRWNERDGYWFLDLADNDNVIIAAGLRVVSNWNLLKSISHPNCPPGALVALNTEGTDDPGRYDFGSKIPLIYQEAES